MTSQELYEDVQRQATDMGVRVWISMDPGTYAQDGEPYGEAGKDDDGWEAVWLSHPPTTSRAYLVALHELGHHATRWGRQLLKERESLAWEWAIEHSIIPLGPDEWATVAGYLASYDSNRAKPSERFDRLLLRARALSVPTTSRSGTTRVLE